MAKLLINDDKITITLEPSAEDMRLLSVLSGKVPVHVSRNRKKAVVSSSYIMEALEVFRNITDASQIDHPGVKAVYTKQRDIKQELLDLTTACYEGENNFLMTHQRMGLAIARKFKKFGFFYSVRSGKTPMALSIISEHSKEKWLIVAPLVLMDAAWLEDAGRFFPDLKITKLHDKSRAKRLKQFQVDSNVYIINTESFAAYIDELTELGITGVILDESSSLKSPTSKFSKAFSKYADTLNRVYLLSGTPAPNGEHEYYGQLRAIDKYSVHQSFTQFKNAFFTNVSFNPQFEKLKIRPECTAALNTIIERNAIYVDAQDYFKFPGRSFDTIEIQMPEQLVKDFYKPMLKIGAVQVGRQEILSESESATLNKLRQISSGFLYDEEHRTYQLSTFKLEALLSKLQEIGTEQVLIWANYKAEFDMIVGALGDRCLVVNGSTDGAEKIDNIRKFKSGSVQYLVANPASMSMGVTLTNAHVCIYYSVNYSYELYAQSLARIYGGVHSQPNFCEYYFISVAGSLDGMIYKALSNKEDASTAVLDYIRAINGRQ